MIIRCRHCGKPVYTGSIGQIVECSYCYQSFSSKDEAEYLPDWKRPLYDYALGQMTRAAKKNQIVPEALECLYLLGEYEDSTQELNYIVQRLMFGSWGEYERVSTAWEAEQLVEKLEKLTKLYPPGVLEALAWPPGNTADHVRKNQEKDLASLLKLTRQKLQDLTRQRILDEIRATWKELLEYNPGPITLQRMINRISPYAGQSAEAERLLSEINERLEKLEQIRKDREEQIQKEKRRKKFIKRVTAAAAFLGILFGTLINRNILQPKKYEEAMELFRQGQYGLADEEFQSLSQAFWFPDTGILEKAKENRKLLLWEWAQELESEGDYKAALSKYLILEDESEEKRLRLLLAQRLEEEGDLEAAIIQYELLDEQEEKLRTLYEKIGQKQELETDFEAAMASYKKAYLPETAGYGETEAEPDEAAMAAWEQANYRYGMFLAERGRIEDALRRMNQAGSSVEAIMARRELQVRLGEEYAALALEEWDSAREQEEEEKDNIFLRNGRELHDLNAILRYCTVLDEAGIDFTGLFPDGIAVKDVIIPLYREEGTASAYLSEETLEEILKILEEREAKRQAADETDQVPEQETDTVSEQMDTDVPTEAGLQEKLERLDFRNGKILPFIRVESAPEVYAFNIWRSSDIAWKRESTIYFQPELWQKLSPEKRAYSESECTGLILGDSYYSFRKTITGTLLMWDYLSGGKNTTKTFESDHHFSTYTAHDRVIAALWMHPDSCEIMNHRTDSPKYDIFGGKFKYDLRYDKGSLSAPEAGLSGTLDPEWVTRHMEEVIANVNE